MMRSLLCLLVGCCAMGVEAALSKAWWSVEPARPYVGQSYALVLTVETEPKEEICDLKLSTLPQEVRPEITQREVNGKRQTRFSFEQRHPTARLVALPLSQLRAGVQTMTHSSVGFYSFNRSTQSCTVPAFSYEVRELPELAKGAILGDFTVTLTAAKETFTPGEVVQVTAQVTMTEGRLPESFPLTLKDGGTGRCYPFRVEEDVRVRGERLTAKAFYVPMVDQPITLTLEPITAFHPTTEKLTSIAMPTLTLTPASAETDAPPQAITLHLGNKSVHGLPLRFAPREGALIVGALTSPHTALETYGPWTRVHCASGEGWIETRLLGETP